MNKLLISLAMLIAGLSVNQVALAQAQPENFYDASNPYTPEEVQAIAAVVNETSEWSNRVKTAEAIGALGENLFGDEVSYNNGQVSFTQVDIDLPGNNALPVRVARTFSSSQPEGPTAPGFFGEWDLDIPYMSGVFARNKGWLSSDSSASGLNRCSAGKFFVVPPITNADIGSGRSFGGNEYWRGNQLYVPGARGQTLLRPIGTQPMPTRQMGKLIHGSRSTTGECVV